MQFYSFKMPVYNYNFNSLYICAFLLVCHMCHSNFEYINIIVSQLYSLNQYSFIIAINLVGLYLFLKNIQFEVNLKCSYSNP